jgi:hypothetical protein
LPIECLTPREKTRGWQRTCDPVRRILPFLVGLLACEGPPPPADPESSGLELSTLIRTDSTAYSLRWEDPGWTTTIGFAYLTESDTVYIVNCNGAILMNLQKRESEGWTDAWYAEGNGCLSPPIVVPPGDVFRSEVVIWGAELGNRSYNTFRVDDIDGEYRLVWNQPVHHYEPGPGSFGDTIQLAKRVSNQFTLKRLIADPR